ncbi:hypothetical protein ACLOJK_006524 [Asimina triloba]
MYTGIRYTTGASKSGAPSSPLGSSMATDPHPRSRSIQSIKIQPPSELVSNVQGWPISTAPPSGHLEQIATWISPPVQHLLKHLTIQRKSMPTQQLEAISSRSWHSVRSVPRFRSGAHFYLTIRRASRRPTEPSATEPSAPSTARIHRPMPAERGFPKTHPIATTWTITDSIPKSRSGNRRTHFHGWQRRQ